MHCSLQDLVAVYSIALPASDRLDTSAEFLFGQNQSDARTQPTEKQKAAEASDSLALRSPVVAGIFPMSCANVSRGYEPAFTASCLPSVGFPTSAKGTWLLRSVLLIDARDPPECVAEEDHKIGRPLPFLD